MAFVFAQILLGLITNVVIPRNKINPTKMIPKEILDRFDAFWSKIQEEIIDAAASEGESPEDHE